MNKRGIVKSKILVWVVLLAMMFSTVASYGDVPIRSSIQSNDKWKLEHIYATDAAWEQDYSKLDDMIGKIEQYKGKLSKSADELLAALTLRDDMKRLMDKVYVYANMKYDEDQGNDIYKGMADRAESLNTKLSTALSFMEPELSSMDQKIMTEFMEQKEGLKVYNFYFDNLFRMKAHTLSAGEEQILALAGDMASTPSNIHGTFKNVDRKLGKILDEQGKEIILTGGTYSRMLDHPNRELRKQSFEVEFTSYNDYINTIAGAMSGEVKKNIFFAKAKKYDSALAWSLDQNNIKPEVYNSLIEAVNKNLAPLHKYVALRKKALGIQDKVHYYDMYVTMVNDVDTDIKYEDGKKMVAEALTPLGNTYISDLMAGFSEGWVDVYETQNKRSGAYQWGSYDTHPYVLLNYNGSLDDVLTIAHEMGHALNSYYSNKSQPYATAEYPIFTAEVASTTNESLMLDYLIKNAKTKEEKMYLINTYLENIRGSIYTQLMYAEFEKLIHEKAEAGEALSATALNEMWGSLMQKYYGPDFEVDELVKVWWARIPHFYYTFYVYQYATGMAAAEAISYKIINEGQPARDAYLDFLAAGGSDYPVEILKKAGVDMSSTMPVEKALAKFDQLVDELDQLMSQSK